MWRWASRRSGLSLLAVSGAMLMLCLSACSGGSTSHTGAPGSGDGAIAIKPKKQVKPPTGPAVVTASVQQAATDVPVDTPVTVSASGGTLQSVSFTTGGTSLPGSFNAGKSSWTADGFLAPSTHYIVRSAAVNAAGQVTHSTRSFTTEALTLNQQTYPSVAPLEGQVMGIGMPVVVTFDIPVTNRAEFQKYMHVTSDPPQPGTWSWVSDQEVHWRPKTYWQAGTKVTVTLDLQGVNAGNGIYGQVTRVIHFSIGQSVLIKANLKTDHEQVFLGGKLARTIPITAGQEPQFTTRSGISVISQKYPHIDMNSASIGINPDSPEGYNIPDVQWAMRITNSGEFLHAAPWSVYAQGHENVSHGCVGMSTENAHWVYEHAEVGTPVEITGTNRPLDAGNGWTDWNESWAQFKAGSALK